MSHAGHWLNTARRELAHVRAYLDSGQYGECRDSEQACLRTCRHGSITCDLSRVGEKEVAVVIEVESIVDCWF